VARNAAKDEKKSTAQGQAAAYFGAAA